MSKVLLIKRAKEEARNNFYLYNSTINERTVVNGMEIIAERLAHLKKHQVVKCLRDFNIEISANPVNWYGMGICFYKSGDEIWEVKSDITAENVMAKDIDVYLKDTILKQVDASSFDVDDWVGFAWVLGLVDTIDYSKLADDLIDQLINQGMYEDEVRELAVANRLSKIYS